MRFEARAELYDFEYLAHYSNHLVVCQFDVIEYLLSRNRYRLSLIGTLLPIVYAIIIFARFI